MDGEEEGGGAISLKADGSGNDTLDQAPNCA